LSKGLKYSKIELSKSGRVGTMRIVPGDGTLLQDEMPLWLRYGYRVRCHQRDLLFGADILS